MKLKWMEYSNDTQTTPTYSKLLKFLDMQAWHFESVTSEWKPQTATHRSYTATVKRMCLACGKGGNHPLGACSKFQGMSREERWYTVKKAALCKNCLKPGNIVNKCCAPPVCKKCNKHDHTLLHIEADPKMEGTKVSQDVTNTAPSK